MRNSQNWIRVLLRDFGIRILLRRVCLVVLLLSRSLVPPFPPLARFRNARFRDELTNCTTARGNDAESTSAAGGEDRARRC